MTWSHGYNIDLGYTYGFYREQDPAWIDLCCIFYGHCPPGLHSEGKIRYLELGCGQGLNLCLLAALNPNIEFVGIDFNPQHIYHGQNLARSAGLGNIRFIEGDFVKLGNDWQRELGKFHYITAHGVLSWISSAVLEGLVKCIDQAAVPGSVVYVSYNTFPGWLSTVPVQHLLRLWQVREGISSERALEVGFKRLQRLIEINSSMCRVLPAMKVRLEKFPTLDKAYLIQEYLHDNWRPFWYDEVATLLSDAKLSFLGTATTSDWFLPGMLPQDWRDFLNEFNDPVERETLLDVLINQSFRRDIFVRGKMPLWAGKQREILLETRFALINRPVSEREGEDPFKFQTSLGEVRGKSEVYAPLYDALASGPKKISELLNVPLGNTGENNLRQMRTLSDTLQALGLMLNAGHLAILRNINDRSEKVAKSLNRALMKAVFQGAPYRYLVSSALPWVIGATDSDMILGFLVINNPKLDATGLGRLFAENLISLGRGLLREGKPVTAPDEVKAYSIEIARTFLTRTLPNWQRLGIF